METAAKKAKKNYITWNNEDRQKLIIKRIELDHLFTKKNANSNEGWKKVAANLINTLGAEKDAGNCKTQWNAIIKKYKSFFKYKTGEGTGEEAKSEDAKNWIFYDLIHRYASMKDNYHPPFLIDSSAGVILLRENSESNESTLSSAVLSPLDIPSTSTSSSVIASTSANLDGDCIVRNRKDNERSRLEKYIYKRDRKLNKKMSGLLSVFDQMVQQDYPGIDASQLLVSSESDTD